MVLTIAKPNNKEIRKRTQRYNYMRPYRPSVSKLGFPFFGRNVGFIEIGKYYEHDFYKRNIVWYFWNIGSIRKNLPVFPAEQAVFDKIKELEKNDKTGTDTHISYINQDTVETLLGEKGKKVLGETIVLIGNAARKFKQPLHKIEVQCVSDIEVKDWNYVLVVLSFDSDFDTANEYLHLLYRELDSLVTTLTYEEQNILQGLIYFDVETTAIISSS